MRPVLGTIQYINTLSKYFVRFPGNECGQTNLKHYLDTVYCPTLSASHHKALFIRPGQRVFKQAIAAVKEAKERHAWKDQGGKDQRMSGPGVEGQWIHSIKCRTDICGFKIIYILKVNK